MAGISQLGFGQRTPLATGSDSTIAPPAARASLHFLKIVVLVHAYVGGLAHLEARFTMHGRTDSDRAVVTLDVEQCDDRGSWGFRDQQ